MPYIIVSRLPKDFTQIEKGGLREFIKETVANVKALKVGPEHTTVDFFHSDDEETRAELIVQVVGLFERLERTESVIKELQTSLGDCILAYFRNYTRIIESVEVLSPVLVDEKFHYVAKNEA